MRTPRLPLPRFLTRRPAWVDRVREKFTGMAARLAPTGRLLVKLLSKLAWLGPLLARMNPVKGKTVEIRRVRPRTLLPWLIGGLAGTASIMGTARAIQSESNWALPIGVALHIFGVYLSLLAARLRRRGDISEAETDIVLTAAAFVPGFGPAIAWSLPRPTSAEAVENAHEVIERYHDHVKPVVPDYERSLFTGDPDKDLARKLDAESFREVLAHGDTDQKRSALFRLAELGAPHHIALIRDCLVDDDGEVRLYAYGELDRLTRVFEEEIGKSRRAVEAREADFEPRLRLSNAHFDLSASGVLDPRTASFHFRAAANEAQIARNLGPGELEPVLAEARAHARLGDLDAAANCLDEVPDALRGDASVCLARAEVAFSRRDFAGARIEAGALLMTETELPGWLQAICMTPEGKVLAQFEDILDEIREEAAT